jgi:hypothetical protein
LAQRQPELRRGRLVWAVVRDRRGVPKQRPLIILTPTDAIDPREPLLSMAVTTTFADPPPPDGVPLPWHPQGRVVTKLRKRSPAVLSWVVELNAEDIMVIHGDVPVKLMQEILRKLDEQCGNI